MSGQPFQAPFFAIVKRSYRPSASNFCPGYTLDAATRSPRRERTAQEIEALIEQHEKLMFRYLVGIKPSQLHHVRAQRHWRHYVDDQRRRQVVDEPCPPQRAYCSRDRRGNAASRY